MGTQIVLSRLGNEALSPCCSDRCYPNTRHTHRSNACKIFITLMSDKYHSRT
jgi:hypothetical protein